MIWNENETAREIMEPVEWKEGDWQFRLMLPSGGVKWCVQWRWTEHEAWKFQHTVTDHEAACLHRDHARRWLLEHGIAIEDAAEPPDYKKLVGFHVYSPSRNRTLNADGQWPAESYVRLADAFATYDAALIAAILAVGKK